MLSFVSEFPSFLWLNNILWYADTTFCLSFHPSADVWIASTFPLLRRMLLWTWVVPKPCFRGFLKNTHPEVESLDHTDLVLIFWETSILFPCACWPFYPSFWLFQTVTNLPALITSETLGSPCVGRLFLRSSGMAHNVWFPSSLLLSAAYSNPSSASEWALVLGFWVSSCRSLLL